MPGGRAAWTFVVEQNTSSYQNKIPPTGKFKQRDLLFHRSEGWKSKVKVSAGLIPSEVEGVLQVSPSFWGLLAIVGVP